MFIEKFIVDPRHIEIQVLGDKHGNVIHLGERECSIQRRNQKVIEEAPSPLLDAATRKKMGEQAVALARAVGYDSAGTVEFVAGQDRSFFFLEMNTRLQVEHPVTELVTGIDLVEQMIRVAAGEPLKIRQADVRLDGWAVESRVYAEDPTRNFLPSIGRLTTYRPPQEKRENGITVRNDTGVYEGGEISIWYDPMIAKLVTHAATREAAIDAQAGALDAFAIEGIRHNIPFLAALMAHPRWRAGELSTGFIAEEFKDGFRNPAPHGESAKILSAVAVAIDHKLGSRKRRISGQLTGRAVMRATSRRVWLDTSEYIVEIADEGGTQVQFGDAEAGLVPDNGEARLAVRYRGGAGAAGNKGEGELIALQSGWKPGEPVWSGTVNGKPVAVQVRPVANGFLLSWRGTFAKAQIFTAPEADYARLMPVKVAADTGKKLLCPMPGLVKSIAVGEGQEVKTGETLAVVEAMKMENVLRAERDGTVKKLHAKPGDSLAVDAVILEFA
jgi:propionyl-CoA carboxylase alpha chain